MGSCFFMFYPLKVFKSLTSVFYFHYLKMKNCEKNFKSDVKIIFWEKE